MATMGIMVALITADIPRDIPIRRHTIQLRTHRAINAMEEHSTSALEPCRWPHFCFDGHSGTEIHQQTEYLPGKCERM